MDRRQPSDTRPEVGWFSLGRVCQLPIIRIENFFSTPILVVALWECSWPRPKVIVPDCPARWHGSTLKQAPGNRLRSLDSPMRCAVNTEGGPSRLVRDPAGISAFPSAKTRKKLRKLPPMSTSCRAVGWSWPSDQSRSSTGGTGQELWRMLEQTPCRCKQRPC